MFLRFFHFLNVSTHYLYSLETVFSTPYAYCLHNIIKDMQINVLQYLQVFPRLSEKSYIRHPLGNARRPGSGKEAHPVTGLTFSSTWDQHKDRCQRRRQRGFWSCYL